MDGADIELEICGNCKKEIPHFNYVMHTAHCARNITLCPICKEPIPKNEFEKHKSKHKSNTSKVNEKIDFPKQISKFNNISQPSRETVKNVTSSSSYTSSKKVEQKTENKAPFALRDAPPGRPKEIKTGKAQDKSSTEANACYVPPPTNSKTNSLLPCKFCDLELPKLDLEGHENYCGARTDKCNVCGEIVMFKYKKLHEDTNHGFLKLNDEPGPRPSWDSNTERPPEPSYIRRQRPQPIYTVDSFDFSPLYNSYSGASINDNDKKESYKDISRRLDCKTEYIRNLLHDSASITVPLRRSGTAPRNHFYNHDKGPAPQPPHRRPNPPTELLIPCEFCHTPVPHEDLIQHETGCRPDLARFNPRRRSPSPDDYFVAPEPTSPEVELPCEFCADMFPASQLLRHQLTCS